MRGGDRAYRVWEPQKCNKCADRPRQTKSGPAQQGMGNTLCAHTLCVCTNCCPSAVMDGLHGMGHLGWAASGCLGWADWCCLAWVACDGPAWTCLGLSGILAWEVLKNNVNGAMLFRRKGGKGNTAIHNDTLPLMHNPIVKLSPLHTRTTAPALY